MVAIESNGICTIARPVTMPESVSGICWLDTTPTYTVPCTSGTVVCLFPSKGVNIASSPLSHTAYVPPEASNVSWSEDPNAGDAFATLNMGSGVTGNAGLVDGHDVINCAV